MKQYEERLGHKIPAFFEYIHTVCLKKLLMFNKNLSWELSMM